MAAVNLLVTSEIWTPSWYPESRCTLAAGSQTGVSPDPGMRVHPPPTQWWHQSDHYTCLLDDIYPYIVSWAGIKKISDIDRFRTYTCHGHNANFCISGYGYLKMSEIVMCFLLLESLGCPIPRPQNQSIILLQLKVGQAHASYEVYMCLTTFFRKACTQG